MVRADEIENLIYQGVAGHMSYGSVKAFPGRVSRKRTTCYFHRPILIFPHCRFGNKVGYVDSVYDSITGIFSNSVLYMYSPDVLF